MRSILAARDVLTVAVASVERIGLSAVVEDLRAVAEHSVYTSEALKEFSVLVALARWELTADKTLPFAGGTEHSVRELFEVWFALLHDTTRAFNSIRVHARQLLDAIADHVTSADAALLVKELRLVFGGVDFHPVRAQSDRAVFALLRL